MRTWLVLDVNYLCWRAFHSTGGIQHNGAPIGIIPGVLRDVVNLKERFLTEHVAFCFDSGKSLRRFILPEYKRRPARPRVEERRWNIARAEIRKLETEVLPQLGFVNVFSQEGYEADDMVAQVCSGLPGRDRGIIVTSDHDLYQLISLRVIVFNPASKKVVDLKAFKAMYGLAPEQWPDVKAIAGCHSDNVPGVEGVGEKTAAQFLTGVLKPSSAKFRKIALNNTTWRKNLRLVSLPYPGAQEIVLRTDHTSSKRWRRVLRKFKISDILMGGSHG